MGRRHQCGLLVFFFALAAALIGGWTAVAQSASPEKSAILAHLSAAISWYRRISSLDITAGQPSDVLYLEDARRSAADALKLAFEASRAQAALLAPNKASGAGTAASPAASDQQSPMAQAIANANSRITQTQTQLADLSKQIGRTFGKKREAMLSQREALQGELDLEKTILDALQKITSVTTENNGTGLAGQINQLKQSVAEVFTPAGQETKKAPAPAAQNSKSSVAGRSGIFGQTATLLGLVRDIHDIDLLMSQTARLRDTADKLDAPLRDSLKSLVQQGRDLVNQPPVSSTAQVAAMRAKFQDLKAQFQQLAAAAVPLREEIILLDQCRVDLQQWRGSIDNEYDQVLRSLLTRVVIILIALGFVWLLSAMWRRAAYRYIQDVRRRRQLMLIRRFVTGFLMLVVISLGFISEFSSLATFAGFLTAGIAVALQAVILSTAAYFFLIGRYGVRVGDRITVQGLAGQAITGEVIEIGLIRLYLLELAGTGIDLHPTGRVVVFSNSVMFQATPFFKPLPGTTYAWHEVALTLAPEANHAVVEQKLLAVVNAVYARYRASIEHQHAVVERVLGTSIAVPEPNAKLSFGESGLEFVLRYPVEIQQSAEIDGEITRKLMEVIGSDAELKAAVSGSPKLRAAIKA
jgi:small-conductance mechanosensitive channel